MTPTGRPSLSVCIPTFQRAELLRTSLGALGRECRSLRPDRVARLEIIVSDNASTDGTSGVAEEFAAGHQPYARYLRRPENIGGDNIYACVETATGEFAWIISDDDLLLPGALTRIFDVLDEESPDAVAVNTRSFRDSPDEVGGVAFKGWSGRQRRTGDELFAELGTMLTFLSVLVFRRALVEGVDYGFASGSELVQAYAYADVINRGTRFVTLGDPVLAYRLANQGSYDYARVFVDNYLDVLEYARASGLSPATFRRMKREHLRAHVLLMMLNFKRHGAAGALRPDWRGTRERVRRRYRDDPVGRAAVTAVTLLPSPVVTRLEDLARRIRPGAR